MLKQFQFILVSFSLVACNSGEFTSYSAQDWSVYLGDEYSNQYSLLNQIDTANAHLLELAWEYHCEDGDSLNRSQIQCNPLVIDGALYGTSPKLKLFALDAARGMLIWEFDPFEGNYELFGMGVNRGLVYWERNKEKRIYYSCGSNLFAIDARSGKLIPEFGDNGAVDLHKGLGRKVDSLFIVNNTPGVIYKNLLIMGSRVSENIGPVPGHIRAFDIHTGEMKWIFHTIPFPGEFGYDSWPADAYLRSGGANAWAGLSLDRKRGLVFVPTGSASFDFYGGDRIGANLFANCILALDAKTGKRIWHYQTIHHDIWDRDLPAPPNLLTITKDGKPVDALAQITKSGYLFVLNRETGEPLYPVEEVPVAVSTLEGEQSWPTQPVPSVYPPFSRVTLNIDDLAVRNKEARDFAKSVFEENHYGEQFIPPSVEGSIIFPGYDGGGEWGGAAYDPNEYTLFVNSNEMPWYATMEKSNPAPPGQMIYTSLCQSCHSKDFTGNQMYGNVPSLIDLDQRLSKDEIGAVIRNGKGLMVGFGVLNNEQISQVTDFIRGKEMEGESSGFAWPYPYRFRGYDKIKAPDGYPVIRPPWGQLTAIDMNNANIKWQIPLGNHENLNIPGYPVTGTENYGGPVVTAGGLLIIAATSDEKIRIYNSKNGKLFWEHDLPAAGFATPATYMVEGKQYIVIACGGGKLGMKSGDSYVAFSLH